jgi:hypothetical protein
MSDVINGVPRELLEQAKDYFSSGVIPEHSLAERFSALLTAQPQASMCETMRRPKAECGCPDCGSSLIDWPQASAAQSAPTGAMTWDMQREAQQCLWVMRELGSMDAEDVTGDNVDLRFEDEHGADTGCDVSIVEYAERTAKVLEAVLLSQSAPAGEREAFEAFARDACRIPAHIPVNWEAKWTQQAWEGWQARAAWRRAQSAPVVPEGWKLVPEQPTDSMVQAVIDSGYYATPATAWPILVEEYKAMLSAAPAQPAAQGYVIVPVDPTPKMLVAYMETDGAVKRWKAMVAASKTEGAHA